MTRIILNESPLPKSFWMDVVNVACYVMNRVFIRPILNKTPYELYFGRKPNISHFHIFGCKFHNNGKDNLDKFDPKSNEALFNGYSSSNKTFHIFDEFSSSDDRLREEKDQGNWMDSNNTHYYTFIFHYIYHLRVIMHLIELI